MTTNCNVIYDLLPLYVDGVCSKESMELVEEHLAECPQCAEKHRAMTRCIDVGAGVGNGSSFAGDSGGNVGDERRLIQGASARKVLRRLKRRWLMSVLALLLLVPPVWLGINEYTGEGVNYTNMYDHYRAGQFIQALKKDDYEKAFSFVDVRFYYDDIQESLAASKTASIDRDSFQLVEYADGTSYYIDGNMQIPAEEFDEWLVIAEQEIIDTREWFEQSPYGGMSYETFYNISKANFLENMQKWDSLGYAIKGSKMYNSYRSSGGYSHYNYYVYLSDGRQTFTSDGITFGGNGKGKFYFAGGFQERRPDHAEDSPISPLLEALSVFERNVH